MPIALFCFRFHKKSGNESEYRIDIGLAVEEGVSDEVACTCCNHKKTLPTGDLDLLAIAQNLASARTFCKLEYCLNEKFTPYCLDKSPILDWSLFNKNHYILLPCSSGKDFSTLKPWKLSDFKNLKN